MVQATGYTKNKASRIMLPHWSRTGVQNGGTGVNTEEARRQQLRAAYLARINAVTDHIDTNISREFTLDELASVAGFSKFHFHRIFYSLTGETLFQFIQRLRLQKGATLLLSDHGKPVTDIALECGFANSSSFAKSFKKQYGVSATAWRDSVCTQDSNQGQTKSNPEPAAGNTGQASPHVSMYIEYVNNTQRWRYSMERTERVVEVKDLPDIPVVYVRYVGPYKGDSELFERLYGQLFRWAGPRNLLRFPETKTIIIYHDNPEITDESKLRISVCISVPPETEVSGEIGKMTVPAGKYALARFELATHEYQEAWDWVFCSWLPESGYLPDDRPCFELYHNDPGTHPEGKCIVDICIAVKPL
jgi:AraC family transcriptional regulator